MKIRPIISVLILTAVACGVIEESADIPKPGQYISETGREGYISKLVIEKRDKGYGITFLETNVNSKLNNCQIEATGKKSSYGIWVEVPTYGPRLPIIIRKRNGAIDVTLKGPDKPEETFQYCLSGRTPVGVYHKQ